MTAEGQIYGTVSGVRPLRSENEHGKATEKRGKVWRRSREAGQRELSKTNDRKDAGMWGNATPLLQEHQERVALLKPQDHREWRLRNRWNTPAAWDVLGD